MTVPTPPQAHSHPTVQPASVFAAASSRSLGLQPAATDGQQKLQWGPVPQSGPECIVLGVSPSSAAAAAGGLMQEEQKEQKVRPEHTHTRQMTHMQSLTCVGAACFFSVRVLSVRGSLLPKR